MTQKALFTEKRFVLTVIFVTSLFLLWGIAITMADVLNKHFQHVLHLSKSQSAFVQFSVFGAYFVMGIPAGLFMKRYGYKKGVLLGLGLFALGAFLFVPAAYMATFSFFGIALFVMGCGMSTLETVAHPFIAALGDQRTSDQRINFAQSFNAVGAILGPAIGSYFLLSNNTPGSTDLSSVRVLYVIMGVVLAIIAIAFSFVKVPFLKQTESHGESLTQTDVNAVNMDIAPDKPLIKHTHFVWAVIAQLFNVAAQAGTWAFFINYGHEVMGFTDMKAANYMSLFMVMMLLGRFIGTFLMRFIKPNKLLSIFALANVVMCITVAQGAGWVSYIALLLINFFFSIMFPTIFSLGIKNLGAKTQQASSFLTMALIGGAIFPFIMGAMADKVGVAGAYYAPILCYLVIFAFGAKFYKVHS